MSENDNTPTPVIPPRRRTARIAIAVSAAAALTIGAVAFGAWSSSSSATTPLDDRLQSLVDAGYPAALASVTNANGDHVDAVAGEDDLETGEKPPVDGEVRIASNTKMYVATIVLQLVDEGLVELDEPIDTYLPGLLTGDGIAGTDITVRQLLQHTSGLPEYTDEMALDSFGLQDAYVSPRDLLDITLDKAALFAPGERYEYSNANYLTLGLLIERVTERPLYEHVEERIVEPLELEHTYMPIPGERELRGEHARTYHTTDAATGGDLREITTMDPSFAWAAGSIVASPSDLNAFMQALLDGELLSDASLAEMKTTVPAPDELWPEATYGLGLQSYPLSCGGVAWGHGGDFPGTQTRNAVGPDGTAVTVAVTALPWAVTGMTDEETMLEQYRIVVDALDETLCD